MVAQRGELASKEWEEAMQVLGFRVWAQGLVDGRFRAKGLRSRIWGVIRV